jgi:hypothetical protein
MSGQNFDFYDEGDSRDFSSHHHNNRTNQYSDCLNFDFCGKDDSRDFSSHHHLIIEITQIIVQIVLNSIPASFICRAVLVFS